MKDLEKLNYHAYSSLICASFVARDLFKHKSLSLMSVFALQDKIELLIDGFFKETEYEKRKL